MGVKTKRNRLVGLVCWTPWWVVMSCGASDTSAPLDAGQDAEPIDTGEPDAGQDSGQDAGDTDEEDSETEVPLGTLGEACWKEVFGPWHPNEGLPDCIDGLNCIGNKDEAWCTKKCLSTGEFNTIDPPIQGWCCAARSNPCSPARYWVPMTMSFECIPRTAGLAEPCDTTTEWTGSNRRCAPRCDGETLISETACLTHVNNTFCSYACDLDPDTDTEISDDDCLIEPVFANGCCDLHQGNKYCLIQELCD